MQKRKNGSLVPANYWLRPCKPNELKDLIGLYDQKNRDQLDNQILCRKENWKLYNRLMMKKKFRCLRNWKKESIPKSANDMGFVEAKLCPITIHIGSENVPYHQPYPLSLAKRERMNKVIKDLLEAKIIEESDAPGGAPALLVPRANGKDRLVIDYRSLNRLIKRKQYPIPRVDLEAMNGHKYFALLDLAQGYYQIELAPEERVKTVFVTPDGKYQVSPCDKPKALTFRN